MTHTASIRQTMIDTTADSELSPRRLNVMRFGYAFLGVGLAIPHLVSDDMNAATREVLFSCSFVVVIVAVIPWRYVWRRYVRTPGDAWR